MKQKVFMISLAFCLLSSFVFSQTEKGKFLIAGRSSLDFIYSGTKLFGDNITSEDYISSDSYNLEFSPALGYFVKNNLAVGLGTSYSISDGDYQNKTSQLTIMPTVMYYFLPESKIHPFIQPGFGYANVSQEMSLGTGSIATESFNGNAWGVGLGVAFMLGNNISLDLNLEYAEVNARFSDDSTIKFQTKGLGALIGFSIYL